MKDVKFDWQGEGAVTVNKKLEMPDFILTSVNNSVCQQKTSTGNFDISFFHPNYFHITFQVIN